MPLEAIALDLIVKDTTLSHLFLRQVEATEAKETNEERDGEEAGVVKKLSANSSVPEHPFHSMVGDEAYTAGHLSRLHSVLNQLQQLLFRVVLESVLPRELTVGRVEQDAQLDPLQCLACVNSLIQHFLYLLDPNFLHFRQVRVEEGSRIFLEGVVTFL